MSEQPDNDSKTEDPSEKRLRDALQRGETPSSREAGIFASLAGILVVVLFVIDTAALNIAGTLRLLLEKPTDFTLATPSDALQLCMAMAELIGLSLAPVFAIFVAFGLSASFAQGAPRVVLKRIAPKGSRLSLSAGAKRLFGRQGLMEFAKSCAKFLAAAVVVAVLFRGENGHLVSALYVEPVVLPNLIGGMSRDLITWLCAAMLAIAAVDLAFSRDLWWRNLRMTRQELKDEMKDMDGDPQTKARLRSLSRDRKRQRMMEAVPEATVVVANPTHFAVALRYRRDQDAAPIVVAKGLDLIALKIRQIAEESGVPVVEDKPLARALHDAIEIDQMVPIEFYEAVAVIISSLSERHGTRPHG